MLFSGVEQYRNYKEERTMLSLDTNWMILGIAFGTAAAVSVLTLRFASLLVKYRIGNRTT